MTGIRIIDLTKEEEWNRVLAQFQQHDVYFTPGYVKAFQVNGDGEPLLLYYPGERMQAMNIVMKRPVPVLTVERPEDEELKGYSDFVTPYSYGGFLLQGDTSEAEKEALAHAYRDLCRDHKIVAEFNRYQPLIDSIRDM